MFPWLIAVAAGGLAFVLCAKLLFHDLHDFADHVHLARSSAEGSAVRGHFMETHHAKGRLFLMLLVPLLAALGGYYLAGGELGWGTFNSVGGATVDLHQELKTLK